MEIDSQDILLQKCLSQIEATLEWGESSEWSTQDFEVLSQKILAKTQVQLSVITLKRVWGRIQYNSRPTITTLNALAQYVDFENWRAFKKEQGILISHSSPRTKIPGGRKIHYRVISMMAVFLAAAGFILYFTAFYTPGRKVDPSKFTFSSKKVVDVGIPNSVIFDYDASAAKEGDSVFIQQSWDKRLSRLVDRNNHQHTSIYYYPGYFQAKLRINDQVVQEHGLLIRSDGWLPIVDQEPVPVYFQAEDILHAGWMGLDLEKIRSSNIPLQPVPPWVGYYNYSDFGNIYSNDFIFETAIRNEYKEGAAVCQHTGVQVRFEGSSLVIPLCVPGCISKLDFAAMGERKIDLSAFGVDFSDWVKVKIDVSDSLIQVYINQRPALELPADGIPRRFVGMAFRFQGTGSVKSVRISSHHGELEYEENFEARD